MQVILIGVYADNFNLTGAWGVSNLFHLGKGAINIFQLISIWRKEAQKTFQPVM